ncbi:conserved hypothetical protein [delta proteobacterium NaphS2]|nr:conserved hypothetical protein [delta proteobacterium NaphS2]
MIVLVGAAFYIYTHPPLVKEIIKKAVSSATGASFSVEHLSYSLNPIKIHAEGIVVEPVDETNEFSAEIQDISVDCVLEGPFGRKTLVVNALKVKGFKGRMQEKAPAVSKGSGSSGSGGSLLSSLARSFVSFFLFRDVKLADAEIEEGFVTINLDGRKIAVSGLSCDLNADHLLDFQGRILVESPKEQATFLLPDFHVNTTSTLSFSDPHIKFTLDFSNGVLSSPQAEIKNVHGKASINYDRREEVIGLGGFHLTLEKTRLKNVPQREPPPLDIRLRTEGHIDLTDQRVSFTDMSLGIDRLVQLEAKVDAGFKNPSYLHVNIGEGRIFPGEFVGCLPEDVRKNVQGLSVSGPVDFSGIFEGKMKQNLWVFDCNVTGKTENIPVSFRTKDIHMNGLVTTQVAIQGPLSRLPLSGMSMSGKFMGNQMAFEKKGLLCERAETVFDFSGTYPDFDITDLSFLVPEMNFLMGKENVPISKMKIGARQGHVNVIDQSMDFPEIRFTSSQLKNIQAAFQMSGNRLKLRAQGTETGLVQAASHLSLVPSDWTFKGTDTVTLTAAVEEKGTTSFSADFGFKNLGFQNPGETAVGENITLNARFSGTMEAPSSSVNAKVEVTADSGELLMGRFYFDLGENAFRAQCNGSYHGLEKRLTLKQLSLGMKDILTAHVTGRLFQTGDEYEGDLSLNIPESPLNPPFQKLIREPFQLEKPALSKVALDGTVNMDMHLRGTTSRWVSTGKCIWKSGTLSYENPGVTLNGIQLSLPISLADGAGEEGAETLKGSLSVLSMQLPFLPEQALNIPLQAAPNRLFMPDVITLAVPGGEVRVGPSEISGLMEPSPAIHTAVQFEKLQLAPILSGIWPQPISGSARGDLNPILIRGGQLQSMGEIAVSIFDGKMRLSKLGVRGLFSALPVYRLNADWDHLNLARMTQGTSFGKIDGILNGYAKNIEISNGQLQRFDLLLDTVKTDDIPQKISVKAVDNIARIGGGQSPFVGMAGIFVSLFKEFPYQKIGVHATLENDVFSINGTIHEDGREYLVKRGFFSGVDVINQNKDNRVGFKDMLKRIKRITSSKGGPIVR